MNQSVSKAGLNRDNIICLSHTLKQICEQLPSVLVVYLFGLQAKGNSRSDSDIDIAVLLDEKVKTSFNLFSFELLIKS